VKNVAKGEQIMALTLGHGLAMVLKLWCILPRA